MATRIQNILADARITLADPGAQRWSDANLLRLLNEAQKDFASETQLLAGRIEIPLTIGDPYFTLPDNVWLVTRVLWGTELLPVISHMELDRLNTLNSLRDFELSPSLTWEADEGSPEAFLYDRRNVSEGKVYPIPDDSIVTTSYTFVDRVVDLEEGVFNNIYGITLSIDDYVMLQDEGVVTDVDETWLKDSYGVVSALGDTREQGYVGDGVFGFTVAIDNYTMDSVYGIVATLYDPDVVLETFNSDYGVITDINETSAVMKIYYVKIPDDIESTDDALITPYMFDKALKYYVVGHAFLNDLDTEYQQKGAQQLQLYERELLKAKNTERRDGARTGTLSTSYRGAF